MIWLLLSPFVAMFLVAYLVLDFFVQLLGILVSVVVVVVEWSSERRAEQDSDVA